MHRFKVWAPAARKMSVQVNGSAYAMGGPDEHGIWRVEAPDVGPGAEYGFLIDDDPKVYPDPRSQWQPNGVHALSRVYDQKTFVWTDARFQAPPLASALIYELHIGTFTPDGTLDAAIAKLDYLAELGVTHVELLPVASFAGNHGWGYDGVALYAVHEPYGGPDALKRFVDAAHQKGIAVLLDVVYNHFGPVGNYTGKFGPYLTEAHRTPWGGAVNLEDDGADQVRRFFCDNALMWMRDFHLDGLRLDAVHAYVDRSAIHFLEQLSTETEQLQAMLGRRLVLIAESDLNDPRVVTSRDAGGLGMDAQWSDDFHHSLLSVLNPKPPEGYYIDFGKIAHLAKSLQKNYVYDGIFTAFRNRVHGKPTGSVPHSRFLGYIQNHDQIGNRALGDRICEIAGFDRAKIAAAVVLSSPFVPMLFQGEEWASSSPFQYFADHDDPEMARLVAEGRSKEFAAFGWDPKKIPNPEELATFERSKLKWDEIVSGEHAEMLEWYKALIRFRRHSASLHSLEPGSARAVFSEDEKWLSIESDSVTLHCNLGSNVRKFDVPEASCILCSRRQVVPSGGSIELPPDTVVLIAAHAS